MPDTKTLYDEDIVAWSRQQAEALRAAARGGSNQPIDWENIAEEIGDLAVSQRSAVGSYVMRIIHHLVKLDHSPAVEPRNGWRRSIRLVRLQIQRRLQTGPRLRPELAQIVEEETKRGIEYAIVDLEEYGEIAEVDENTVRRSRYSPDQVLGDWFPPERARGE